MLEGVRQLMRQQAPAILRIGGILTRSKGDVIAQGIGACVDALSRDLRLDPDVNADMRQITAETRLTVVAHRQRYWLSPR